MDKNVIFRNEQEIIEEHEFISLAANQFNEIGKQLIRLGVNNPTVKEIIEGINRVEKELSLHTLFDWLKGLLVSRMETPKIGELKLDKEKLKDLVTIEADAKPLYLALENAFHIKYDDKRGLLTEYLLTDESGKIVMLENTNKLIANRHTKIVDNEHQLEILGHIKQIIKSIYAIEAKAEARGKTSLFTNALYHNPLSELPYVKFLGSKSMIPNPDYINKY